MTSKPVLQQTLPIDAVSDEVCEHLHSGNVVLQAEPGAGKSTGLPLAILNAGFPDKILMLEPRRIAAENVAARLAAQLDEPMGQTIGLRMRGRTVVSNSTRLEVVTEGVLTRILQGDPMLEGVGLVIFDEFHERSLNADLGLALCLDVQRDVRDDLRLLLMSATLDSDLLCDHLGSARSVRCEVKQHPVEIIWRSIGRSSMSHAVAQTILEAVEQFTGDALVFLPGVSEIHRVDRLLQDKLPANVAIHRLHRGITGKAQAAATNTNSADSNTRRVILSTSIAETSITIDGVSIVIDSGIERRSRLDAPSGIERLESVMASKASATQRTGRAGRTRAGVCYRLWTEESHASRAASWQPEILRSDLSALLLESGRWGVSDIFTLPWIDAPPVSAIDQARATLQNLGIWSANGLTTYGKAVAKFPLNPRIAHMLLWGAVNGCLAKAAGMAALLDDMPRQPSVDLTSALGNLSPVHTRKQQQLSDLARQILDNTPQVAKALQALNGTGNGAGAQIDHGTILAQAYPDRIAKRRKTGQDSNDVRYQLSCGAGAVLHEDDPITLHEYIVVASLGGQAREARIFSALPVLISDLQSCSAKLFNSTDAVQWDDKAERVVAERRQLLGSLTISSQKITDISVELRAATLIEGIKKLGLESLSWSDEAREWQARVERLRVLEGDDTDFPAVNDKSLISDLESWLLPYLDTVNSLKELKKLDLSSILRAMLDYPQQQRLDAQLPQKYKVPSGALHKIRYNEDGNPVLAVKLQEMFGCRDNPSVANGRITLKVELLSPARRPVQVTEDLANFWHNSYTLVKKDLAGRYPKHPWPEDPLNAEATARAKPRKK